MSETDITRESEAYVLWPVRGVGDVKFQRAKWKFWSGWATGLKAKRVLELITEIDKSPMNFTAKIDAKARARNLAVTLGEVFNLKETPEGADKIVKDAYASAGNDADKWAEIDAHLEPGEKMLLIDEIVSEHRPGIMALRAALRDLARKAHKKPPDGIDQMNDEQLIALADEYQPEAKEGEESPLA